MPSAAFAEQAVRAHSVLLTCALMAKIPNNRVLRLVSDESVTSPVSELRLGPFFAGFTKIGSICCRKKRKSFVKRTGPDPHIIRSAQLDCAKAKRLPHHNGLPDESLTALANVFMGRKLPERRFFHGNGNAERSRRFMERYEVDALQGLLRMRILPSAQI